MNIGVEATAAIVCSSFWQWLAVRWLSDFSQ